MHFYNYLAANGLFYSGKYSAKMIGLGGLGDGACDGVLNVPAYQYDLGDCCKPLKGERNQKPHNAVCNFEDDCICHMFTDFHGRILNFKKFRVFFNYLHTLHTFFYLYVLKISQSSI